MKEKQSRSTAQKPQSYDSKCPAKTVERVDAGLLYEIKKERTIKGH